MACCIVRSVGDDNIVSNVLSTALSKYKNFPATFWMNFYSTLVSVGDCGRSSTIWEFFHIPFENKRTVSFAYAWAAHSRIISMLSTHILALPSVLFFHSTPSADAC